MVAGLPDATAPFGRRLEMWEAAHRRGVNERRGGSTKEFMLTAASDAGVGGGATAAESRTGADAVNTITASSSSPDEASACSVL